MDGSIKKRATIKKHFNLPKPMTLKDKYQTVNNFISTTFVRHPFTRLVSAFKDKVVDHNYLHWRSAVELKEGKMSEVRVLTFLV